MILFLFVYQSLTFINRRSREIIIIGGPLSAARQFVLTPVQQALNRYCLEKISQNIPVEISELDENAGLLGVTACLFDTIFSENHTMKHIMG